MDQSPTQQSWICNPQRLVETHPDVLIIGGIRCQATRNVRLVYEAGRERKGLPTIAPHLVRPLSLDIPVYRGDPRPHWIIGAGMICYTLPARFRNPHHDSILSVAEAVHPEPALKPAGRGESHLSTTSC